MRYNIETKSNKPAYLQLYEMIRNDIISDAFEYGDRLPSKRNVADDAGVSVITAAHAYELLCDEGYAAAREKSGYYVIYRADDFNTGNTNVQVAAPASQNRQQPHNVYTHGAGELSFNILARTARKVMLDYAEKILEKSPNQGIYELRYEISRYLARSVGIHAQPEQIMIGAGAEYLYGLVAQLFDNQKTVAVENPGYDIIRKVYKRLGYSIDVLDLGRDGIVSEQLKNTKAQLLHVTPFHSYPSNVSASISKKREYVRWAQGDHYIIEDNYDSELTVSAKMEDTLYSISDNDNVIFINTFSKTIAPSVRVGYMVLPKRLVEIFDSKLGFYSCTVPVLEQLILCELIKSGDFERHINRVRRKLRKQASERK